MKNVDIKKETKRNVLKSHTIKKESIKQSTNLKFGTMEVIALIILTSLVSLSMGFILAKRNAGKETNIPLSNELQNFIKTYNYIKDNYYEEINGEELLETGLKSMIQSLDKYSEYYSAEDFENMSIKLKGEYKGIGVEIINDAEGYIYILTVFASSPAAKAGLLPGDIIKTVNDIDVRTRALSEISNYMKTGETSKFKLIIDRNGEDKEINLNREQVILETVESKIYERNNKKIGYMYISLFASNTYTQFSDKLQELENGKMDSLILDLRDNGGGHLISLEKMLSEFLDSSNLIFKMKQKDNITNYYSKGKLTKKYPIVILVNGNSASASEVMAIALKQKYGATIIGTKTYGKGTVQELNDNSDNKNLNYSFKITTMQWLAPDGAYINEVGIAPDVEISLSDEYINNPSDETDSQLQKALEYLSNK